MNPIENNDVLLWSVPAIICSASAISRLFFLVLLSSFMRLNVSYFTLTCLFVFLLYHVTVSAFFIMFLVTPHWNLYVLCYLLALLMYILLFVGCRCCPPGFSLFLASSLDVPSWFPFLVFQKACFQLSCSSFILFLPTFLFCIVCLRGSVQKRHFFSVRRVHVTLCFFLAAWLSFMFSVPAISKRQFQPSCWSLFSVNFCIFLIVYLHCSLQGFISSPLSLFPMFRSSSLLLSFPAISEHCHFSFCFCLPTLIDDP